MGEGVQMYILLLAVRPGQQAQGRRCWQQERAGWAGTATGISRDRLSEGGGGQQQRYCKDLQCRVLLNFFKPLKALIVKFLLIGFLNR